mmetsp:Transcript_39321/g.47643  ORF Transcript_39321/g.47643 Transcript_39321/m.47643 type:complete len:82 (-) Transcript_39321:2512-2757(-)
MGFRIDPLSFSMGMMTGMIAGLMISAVFTYLMWDEIVDLTEAVKRENEATARLKKRQDETAAKKKAEKEAAEKAADTGKTE